MRSANQNRPTNVRTAVARVGEMETSDRQGDLNKSAQPVKSVRTDPATPLGNASQNRPERQQHPRARVTLPVRLRSADLKDGGFDDVLATLNSCHNGLYFKTANTRFCERMRLHILFPYSSEHDSVQAEEDYGEIVRIDHLPDGQLGIAVLFGGLAQVGRPVVETTPTNSLVQQTVERRVPARYPFSTAAMVVETRSRACLQSRCSDVSVAGCYVDTINPFPEGAFVQLRLSCGQESLETAARVCFSHMGMGMGLAFWELTPEQELVLLEWLDGGGSAEPIIYVAEQPAISKTSDSPDRAMALRLIRLLRSKGSLTEADVAVLLSDHLVSGEELVCRPCADRL
jgi:hypothetical protein